MKFTSWGMACLLGCALMLGSCSSDEGAMPDPAGKGAVRLSLATEMGFEARTKAVDENTYLTAHPTTDYKVKILDDQGTVVPGCEWVYGEMPQGLIELSSGSYTVVASDGEEYNQNASTRGGIYMYGSTAFDVNSGEVTPTVKVSCKPACGKLVVKFGEKMADLFSDYTVRFSTKAAGEGEWLSWGKADTDPLYVKLDKAGETVTAVFDITTKAGKKVEVPAKKRTMKWGSMWTITVNPNVQVTTGKVGITITFDDSTNDIEIPIEIPSDWL